MIRSDLVLDFISFILLRGSGVLSHRNCSGNSLFFIGSIFQRCRTFLISLASHSRKVEKGHNFFSDITSKLASCSELSFSVIKGFNPLNCKFVTCVHAGELRFQKPLDTSTQYICASKCIWCQPNNNPMPQVGPESASYQNQKRHVCWM